MVRPGLVRLRGRLLVGLILLAIVSLLLMRLRIESSTTKPSGSFYMPPTTMLPLAVIMDNLAYDKLRVIGGTGHWFHLLERLLPLLPALSRNVWRHHHNPSTLHIIFQESYGAKDLDSFAAYLLSTLISGGSFHSVVIGHASAVTLLSTIANATDMTNVVEASSFRPYATLTCLYLYPAEGQCSVKLAPLQDGSFSAWPSTFLELAHVSWKHAARKKYNMVTPLTWALFNQAVNRTCPAPPEQHVISTKRGGSPDARSKSSSAAKQGLDVTNDHLSDPPPRLGNKIRKWRNGTNFDPLPKGVMMEMTGDGRRLVLVYQRDLSRQLQNVEEVLVRLQQKIDPSWSVQLMTHSPSRHPCSLVNSVRQATVLITPHGFQSILLLLQPPTSLLVELHPSYYFKPEIFGLVQAGLKQNVGLQRFYLGAQSGLHGWHMHLLSAFLSIPLKDAGYCTGNAVCRHLARLQDVRMEPEFVSRVAEWSAVFH